MAIKVTIDDNFNNPKVRVLMLKGEKGDQGDLNHNDIVDNLTSSATNKVLSAKQGKILKGLVDTNTTNLGNEITARQDADADLQSQITSLASGSPLTASSTSEMTDTTRVYVNTTDGNWYYYNGSAWTVGGVYQATEIANNSVSFVKLDELLQNSNTLIYEKATINSISNGFYKYYSNHTIEFVSGNSFRCYEYLLQNNTYYDIATGLLGGSFNILILDENNNFVYGNDGNNEFSMIYKTTTTGLKLYVSVYLNRDVDGLTFVTKIKNIRKNDTLLSGASKIEEISNKGLYGFYNSVSNYPNLVDLTSYNCVTKIYKLTKGTKYKVSGINSGQIKQFVICNQDNLITYVSGDTYEEKIFIAEDNGYVWTTDYKSNNVIYNAVFTEINTTPTDDYSSHKWAVLGDSITEFNYEDARPNYVDYVSGKLNLPYINYGGSGTAYNTSYGGRPEWYNRIQYIDSICDVITIFGGFNGVQNDGMELGNITDTGTTTVCGCINTTIDNIYSYLPTIQIGIITPSPWFTKNSYSGTTKEKADEFVNKLIAIAEMRSIPCLDIYHKSNLRPWQDANKQTYFVNADGVHPNSAGHMKFAPMILEFVKSLITRS